MGGQTSIKRHRRIFEYKYCCFDVNGRKRRAKLNKAPAFLLRNLIVPSSVDVTQCVVLHMKRKPCYIVILNEFFFLLTY